MSSDPIRIEWTCPVLENRPLNDQYFILTLVGITISRQARPGQFVNLSCHQFLRRPLGILAVDREQGTFQVGIRIAGQGTRDLAGLRPGDTVSVLGPLGHGFELGQYRRIITVGGGTGVFPLYFVQQVCREQGREGLAVCGYRSENDSILTHEFAQIACQTSFAADQGGLDVTGTAAQALELLLQELQFPASSQPMAAHMHQQAISRRKIAASPADPADPAHLADLSYSAPKPIARDTIPVSDPAAGSTAKNPAPDTGTLILTCGPKPMMQAVAAIAARFGLPCQVSLEERMGCGIGICLVCVCKIKTLHDESGSFRHERCCVEGPVFAAEEVVW